MDLADVATAVQDWAVATVPALQGKYDYPADAKDQPLPDVAVEIIDVSTGASLEDFPELAKLDQRRLRTVSVELFLMVAPEPAREASQQLYGFADLLLPALDRDRRLGTAEGLFASRTVTASFRPAFVKFDDETTGRAATVRFKVAQEVR